MENKINIGDLGEFSGRINKKVKILRVDDKYVTYLIIDENKKKYIYLEDFKKKFTKEGNNNKEEKIIENTPKKENISIKEKIKKIKDKVEVIKKPTYSLVGLFKTNKDGYGLDETEDLSKKDLLGYRIRYNKEPYMHSGYVQFDLTQLDEAQRRLIYINEEDEKRKEFQKIKDAENKIKREENKIIEKQKLEAAIKEIIAKPSYLMTLSEYQERVVPILQQYQKFLRKNSEYFDSADYEGVYKYTYPELESDFENKTIKGRKFRISKYLENPLENFKASHYPEDEIVEMNKSFVNKLKNFFTDDEIYTQISKDEFKSNKRSIKRAIDNDTYKNLLDSGELTESELQEIAKSVNVSIPKKVFSAENVKAKEMQEKFQKLLANLPTINKEQLNKLIESIKIDFKPLEEELFIEEKSKYNTKFIKLLQKEKVYVSNLEMTIKIWEDLFSYDKTGYDKIKTGQYKTNYYTKQQEEIIDERQFVTGLKLKSDWENTFDKFLKAYIDTLKYSFINAIINNFDRITKPIKEIIKLEIRLGEKGFEGEYRFKFDDGSYFDFKAEAIRAGGYNIQILHLRYITDFLNITLADGTKVTGYANLIENFNVKRIEKGGVVVDSTENLIEILNKARESKINEWYKNGYKVVVARNDGYVYKIDNQRDAEFIDSKNVSQRKILDIIKDNPDISQVSFRGTIKVGNRVGEELEIADDFDVILWKKDQSLKNGGETNSNQQNIYYHGSNMLFNDIKLLQDESGESKHLGHGIYITNDINVAKKYGTYIYEIIVEEPLKSLNYSSELTKNEMIQMIEFFKNSDNEDLNYLSDDYQDQLDDDDLLWGKSLIYDLERFKIDVNETLLDLGYNSISNNINKLNDFRSFSDNSLNINVIKPSILHIHNIQYEKGGYMEHVGKSKVYKGYLILNNGNYKKMKKGGLTNDDIKQKSDKYKDVLKKPSSLLKISEMHKVSIQFLQSQLQKGIKVESEHTNRQVIAKIIALHHLEEDPNYYIKLEKMEASFENGGKVANITFMKWVIEYNVNNKDEILAFFSLPSKYINPSLVSENNNNVILDVFEKQKDGIDAKKHFQKMLDKADELGVTIYLEPIPRVHKLKSEEHKQKITKDYLIKYYNNFGFTKDKNGFMIRHPKMANGGMTEDNMYTDEYYKKQELSDAVYRAQRNIAYADDVDKAIAEFYMARKVYNDFQKAIDNREDNIRRTINIDNIIEYEKELFERYGDTYEYKELFKKSPFLAALQHSKDMIEWVQSEESKEIEKNSGYSDDEIEKMNQERLVSYTRDVKDLEYFLKQKESKTKKKKLASGGELDPDNKAIKSAMTHKAGSAGGLLVGNRHSEGGIKAVNKSTDTPLEMEGGEVVITRNAVSDDTKREFEGQMLTNRQILSKINESGGGVSFADGGTVPSSCKCSGKSYKYGGKTISDYEIIKKINQYNKK